MKRKRTFRYERWNPGGEMMSYVYVDVLEYNHSSGRCTYDLNGIVKSSIKDVIRSYFFYKYGVIPRYEWMTSWIEVT